MSGFTGLCGFNGLAQQPHRIKGFARYWCTLYPNAIKLYRNRIQLYLWSDN